MVVEVGVDLHKEFSQIAVWQEDGPARQYKVINDPKGMRKFFEGIPAPARVAIEATGTWWWLVDLLEEVGHEPVLSNPKQTKAIAAARLKNDRVDAERLAQLLHGDLLPTVWIPPVEVREARELLRHRMRLVWARVRARNQLTALVARRNLRRKDTSSWYTQEGMRQLRAFKLGPIPSRVRKDGFAQLRLLDRLIREVDKELAVRWGKDPRVQRLMTIPGIGAVIAIMVVVELGEIERFPSAKHVASYMGLTPRVRASAGRVRGGHISKEGNRLLRWGMVMAATQASRRPGPLRNYYRKLKARKGTKIARVALARKIAGIVYHVWKGETGFYELVRRGDVRG